MIKRVSPLLFLLTFLSSIYAQNDVVTCGGSVTTSAGSHSVSVGQSVYSHVAGGNFYVSLGVQQTYCTPYFDTLKVSVCQHSSFVGGSFLIPADSTATIGLRLFNHRHLSVDGCDSIVTLALNVRGNILMDYNVVACDSLVWGDSVYVVSGNYLLHDRTAEGCDSATSLHLTMHHSSMSSTREQAQQQYQWRGQTLIASGNYSDIIVAGNAEGCDSIVKLSLTIINDVPPPVIYSYARRLLIVDHYPFGEDSTLVNYRAYRWYHNGEFLPFEKLDNYYDNSNGQYHILEGCYYVEVPVDASESFWMRSNEICFTGEGGNPRMPYLSVYPNPSMARSEIMATVADSRSGSMLTVHDAFGRLLCSSEAVDGSAPIPVMLSAGSYTVSLRSPQGEVLSRKLIVR